VIKTVYQSSCIVPVLLIRFLMNLEYSRQIFEKYVLNFMRIHPVGRKLNHADGQTDMTKLIVAFRKFANATKNKFFIF
jgi:hypothetical protein